MEGLGRYGREKAASLRGEGAERLRPRDQDRGIRTGV